MRDFWAAEARAPATTEAERCRKFEGDGLPCILRAGHTGHCQMGVVTTR